MCGINGVSPGYQCSTVSALQELLIGTYCIWLVNTFEAIKLLNGKSVCVCVCVCVSKRTRTRASFPQIIHFWKLQKKS